jgi:hypothetical protein
MSQPAISASEPRLCPACKTPDRFDTLARPPMELQFCASCGMLVGVKLIRDRAGMVASPLPVQITMHRAEPSRGAAAAPASRSKGAEPAAAAPEPSRAPTVDPGSAHPKILIGDAGEVFRDQAQSMLLVTGIAEDVITAADGSQLLQEFTRGCREGAWWSWT